MDSNSSWTRKGFCYIDQEFDHGELAAKNVES